MQLLRTFELCSCSQSVVHVFPLSRFVCFFRKKQFFFFYKTQGPHLLHALACCLKSFSFLILLDILLAMTSHTPISLTFRLVINLSLQTHKAEFQSQPRVKRWQCLEVSQGVYLPPNAYDRANVLFNLLYPNSICAPLSC